LLHLFREEIGPEGARAVEEALLENRTLKTVFLGCNGIGVEGAKSIAKYAVKLFLCVCADSVCEVPYGRTL